VPCRKIFTAEGHRLHGGLHFEKGLEISSLRSQFQAVRKIATMKSIPYQTLIRHLIAQQIKKELLLLP